MKNRLKQALSQRQKHCLVSPGRIPSAVLVPIFYKDGEYHLLFTKRTTTVKAHKGQISFPGGACEKEDGTPINTALRECAEEISMASQSVELLGELDDFFTIGSGYIISPFVAAIPWPYPFKADPVEVEEIIEVPISRLLEKDCLRESTATAEGKVVTTYFYDYQGKVIWGATARILNQFLSIWSQLMSTTNSQSI